MRIFRKSADYYDIGMSSGHDDRIMYVRQEKVIGPKPWESSYRNPAFGGSYVFEEIIIGFCGKIYPVIRLSFYSNHDGNVTEHHCYNVDELIEVYEKYKIPVRTGHFSKFSGMYESRLNFLKIDENCVHPKLGKVSNIFIDNRVPIFHIIDQQLTLNPILKDFKFFRLFDSYTAFQEIEMYLGGVLGMIGKDIPEVSDEDRFAAHGFNKESFRMPAGRKKPRRKGKVNG